MKSEPGGEDKRVFLRNSRNVLILNLLIFSKDLVKLKD